MTSFTASESDNIVEIAVTVLDGDLSRNVIVQLFTMDGMARSTW